APISSRTGARSRRTVSRPARARQRALTSPPMPAPAMRTGALTARDREPGSGGLGPQAAGGLGLGRPERRIVAVEGRAIRADDLRLIAHVEEDVRMVEGRAGADAHELPHADRDRLDTPVVAEVRHHLIGHIAHLLSGPARRHGAAQ